MKMFNYLTGLNARNVSSKYILTIPKPVNWLALAALGLLLLKVLVLNQISEVFHGAHELGTVFEGVLASVLASYAFYIIVVHMKYVQNCSAIYPRVTRWIKLIVNEYKAQLIQFQAASGVELIPETLTEQHVAEAFKRIHPYENAPLLVSANQNATWMQFLEYNKNRAKDHISKIISQLVFLDAELVSLLKEIEDCPHFQIMEFIVYNKISNQDLSNLSKSFFEYCEACKALDNYFQNNTILNTFSN